MGDMMLINIYDRRHTGTMSMYNMLESGHIVAIVKPTSIFPAQKMENTTQFTIDGRPVQLLAKQKRTKASVCVFTDSFLE
mmetsp:Transcript_2307/g.4046  ORF Transcript_2307/g.4046 Transcript_2307/m.4046 type:complete len:80 (-) Transcript_2307:1482-1721(-)